jgi:integrase
MGESRSPSAARLAVTATSPSSTSYASNAGTLADYEGPLDDDGRRAVCRVLDPHNVRRAFRKVARALHEADKAAGKDERFPLHFTPHSFRHSFASIHISEGKSIEWVEKQLGHEDVTLTVNTYGSWLRRRTPRGTTPWTTRAGTTRPRVEVVVACGD